MEDRIGSNVAYLGATPSVTGCARQILSDKEDYVKKVILSCSEEWTPCRGEYKHGAKVAEHDV